MDDSHRWDHFRHSRDAPFGRCDECLIAACLMLRNLTLDLGISWICFAVPQALGIS
jgi:hypothetical protein